MILKNHTCLLLLLSIMLLLCSCASNRVETSPGMQLEKEIAKWQSFHMEGMVEIESSAFSVRKYFVLQKNSNSLQLDLLNTGLFGAEPAPLVSIKVDSLLTIDSRYKDLIEGMLLKTGLKQMNFSPYLDFKKQFENKMPEILATGSTKIGHYKFRFAKNMQLKQIISNDGKQNITIQYRKNGPSIIIVDIAKLGKIKMQVEQFVETSCCDSSANLPPKTVGEEQ